MLEIAANNANECKHVDGTTQHLSSVNDHRVLLSSVDPTTNPPTSSIDLTISGKCGNDKQASHFLGRLASSFPNTQIDDRQVNSTKEFHPDCLGVKDIACGDNDMPTTSSDGTYLAVDKFEGLGKFDQPHQVERMSPKDNVPAAVDPIDLKSRCKAMKRRKRVPWSSEYNRRQKNPRRLPRSEMPHDELLKLREKERKAQQLRRERMKRAEEMRLKMRKEKKMNTNDATRDSLMTADGGEGDGILDFHQSSTHLPLDRSVYFDGKPLYNCVLKENFMHALGLQQCDNTMKMKPSMAEFLVNNVVSTDVEPNCLNSVNGEEPHIQQHASGQSLCDVVSEKSQQSMSEETSDSSEKKTNSDGVSRKTRRSRLPKEDLERLREKERLAKRRQRAKNKKCDVNGDARDLPISATSQEEENDSTDTESNADSKINNDNGESSSCADNSEETKRADENVGEKKEDSIKQSDGKRKAFPRYYDRSMLSAEELESLRRREREYQRRRRARLREAKFKAIGALCQEENSLKVSQVVGNEESNIVDDSEKKYETRMSKGISCPSVRFLEHSSVFYCDNEFTDRKTILKDELQPDWKPNEDNSAIDCKPSISVINKVEREHNLEDPQKTGLPNLELGTDRSYLDRNFNSDQSKLMLGSIDKQWNSSPPNSLSKSKLSPLCDAVNRKPTSDGTESKKQDLSRFIRSENDFDDLKSRGGRSICDEPQAVALSVNSTTSMVDALYASDRKILEANGYRCMKADRSYRYYDTQNTAHRTYNTPWDPKLRCSPQPTKYIDGQDGTLYDRRSLEYEFIADKPREVSQEGSLAIKTDIDKGSDASGHSKWRHWKSGLTDSQLQRRRQSNREAQRRRRMRLRLMQMKSSQEQDHIPFEEIMYKRFAPSRRAVANDAIRDITVSKSKLKSMLEKRQKVFIDAQIEKSRNEMETKSQTPVAEEQPKKGRGCRIKVTPKRQVIVPGMGIPSNADVTERNEPTNGDVCFRDFQINGNHFTSQLDELASRYVDYSDFGEQNPHEMEEQTEQTSSRKRKQFCPRRLLSEKERNSVPSLVTAL